MLEFIPTVLLRLAASWGEKHAALEGKASMAGGAVGKLPPREVGQGIAEGEKNQQTQGWEILSSKKEFGRCNFNKDNLTQFSLSGFP